MGRLGNGSQVGKVEVQEYESSLGAGVLFLDGGYGCGGFVFGARGNVDLCIVLVENGGELFANTTGCSCYEEYLCNY